MMGSARHSLALAVVRQMGIDRRKQGVHSREKSHLGSFEEFAGFRIILFKQETSTAQDLTDPFL